MNNSKNLHDNESADPMKLDPSQLSGHTSQNPEAPKEPNGKVKYFVISDEHDSRKRKVICQPCIKLVVGRLELGGRTDEQFPLSAPKTPPSEEKIPHSSEHDWRSPNASEVPDLCVVCHVKLSEKSSMDCTSSFDASTVRPSTNCLTFPHRGHNVQFFNLIQKVKYQLNYFSVKNLPGEKKISYVCELCHKSMKCQNIEQHIRTKMHLLNYAKNSSKIVMEPTITEDYWKFLRLQLSSEDFSCVLCKINLLPSPLSWMEHFESESHVALKSHMLQITAVDSDTSPRCLSAEPLEILKNSPSKHDTHTKPQPFPIDGYLNQPSYKDVNNFAINFKAKKSLKEKTYFTRINHVTQFLNLIKKINDHVNCFLFKSQPELRNLKCYCLLCKKSVPSQGDCAKTVQDHMADFQHVLNLDNFKSLKTYVPSISSENWNYLKCAPLTKTDPLRYFCTLCSERLSELPFEGSSILASVVITSWVKHLQSQGHKSNFQRVLNPISDKDNSCDFNYIQNLIGESSNDLPEGKSGDFPTMSTHQQPRSSLLNSEGEMLYSPAPGGKDKLGIFCDLTRRSPGPSKQSSFSDDQDEDCVPDPSYCDRFLSGVASRLSISFSRADNLRSKTETASIVAPSSNSFKFGRCESSETFSKECFPIECTQSYTVPQKQTLPENLGNKTESGSAGTTVSEPPMPDWFQDLFDLDYESDFPEVEPIEASRLLPMNLFQEIFDVDAFEAAGESESSFEKLTEI